jgi:tetratricopeptide (TPR) repeat protein
LSRENFLFAIIGVLLGFILGFMLHGVMSQRDAERAAASTQERQQLPADHPPVDTGDSGGDQQQQMQMQEVQQTIAKARNDPKDFDAQILAARLEYQIGQYDEAVKFLLTANQIKPEDYEVLVMLGIVNANAGHWDAAEKWYKAAAAKNPKDVTVASSLTDISLRKSDIAASEKAIKNLEKIEPTSPDLAGFRSRLAELKSTQGK